jgi:nitrous oxide reductase accessory protein NosL
MTARSAGVRSAALAVMALAIVSAGCFHSSKRPVPKPLPVQLEIRNHAFADMDVYVVPSPGSSSSIRLATVSGFAKASLTIRTSQLQPGNVLQIELHAIGSRSVWYSPQLAVSPGEHVMLEINADASGYLGRTLLYPLPDPDGGDQGTDSGPRSRH